MLSAEGSGGAEPTGLCGVLSLEPAERCCLVLGLSTNRGIGGGDEWHPCVRMTTLERDTILNGRQSPSKKP